MFGTGFHIACDLKGLTLFEAFMLGFEAHHCMTVFMDAAQSDEREAHMCVLSENADRLAEAFRNNGNDVSVRWLNDDVKVLTVKIGDDT